MTCQQIKYLLEIYKTGSVAAAAQSLYLVPSSLSISLRNLEQEFGCRIFTRTKNGMIPTPKGIEIIHNANRIYTIYNRMIKVSHSTDRRIHIAGTDFEPVNDAFVRLVAENTGRQDITFSKTFAHYQILTKKLIAGEVDLLILAHHEPQLLAVRSRAAANRLELQVLKKIPAVATIGPGHRLYDQEEINYRELENDMLTDRPSGPVLYNRFLKSIVRLRPEKTLLVSSPRARERLVEEGLAYTIGMERTTPEIAARRLRQIRLGDLHYVLIALYNPVVPMQPEIQRYLELLKEELNT